MKYQETGQAINAITEKDLEQHFSELGYQIEAIDKVWRHFAVRVKKDKTQVQVKVAGDNGVNRYIVNQTEWQDRLAQEDFTIKVLPTLFTGELKGNSYFGVKYLKGAQLCQGVAGADTKTLEATLPIIAKYLDELDTKDWKFDLLPKDQGQLIQLHTAKVLETAEEYLRKADIQDNDLLKYIGERQVYRVTYQHGNFVPWHIISNTRGQLYLIDGEHAAMFSRAYSDAAYFLHRLCSVLQRFDLALKWYELITANLTEQARAQLQMLIAAKIASGYWEAKVQKWFPINTQDQLREMLLRGKI